MKKILKRYDELDLARAIAIICMILVHFMYAVYDYSNMATFYIIDFLGSPFAAPVFMFIMGINLVLTSHNKPIDFFKRGLRLFCMALIFNIICHALPFFILGAKLKTLDYAVEALHWIGAVDILSFSGIAFMFYGLLKKLKINNWGLAIIALVMSACNTYLAVYAPIDFESHMFLASFTSLFYTSSIVGYFSLFGWFIFPIAGKIYMDAVNKYKNSELFHFACMIIGLVIYLIMLLGSTKLINGGPLIDFNDEYSYYRMHIYGGVMNVAFVISWINILHFVVKLISKKDKLHIQILSYNLTNLYLVQWFLINYIFVLAFNNTLKVNTLNMLILFIFLLIMTNGITYIFKLLKNTK